MKCSIRGFVRYSAVVTKTDFIAMIEEALTIKKQLKNIINFLSV